MNKHTAGEFSDMYDLDVLKHEVHVAPVNSRQYEQSGFLAQTFQANKHLQHAFLSMDQEFKQSYYDAVKIFHIDPSASNNPFYVRKYRDFNHILQKKARQPTNIAVEVKPIHINKSQFDLFKVVGEGDKQRKETAQQFGNFQSSIKGTAQVGSVDLIGMDDIQWTEGKNFGRQSTLSKSQNFTLPAVPKFKHTFQMTGKGADAIFDLDEDGLDKDYDDQFGQITKPVVQPMFKLPKQTEKLGNIFTFNDKVNLKKAEAVVNISDLIDIAHNRNPQAINAPAQMAMTLGTQVAQDYLKPNNQINPSLCQVDIFQNMQPEGERLGIFDLELDDNGNQIVQVVCNQSLSSEGKVVTGTNSAKAQLSQFSDFQSIEGEGQKPKNSQQLQQDIYKSIQDIRVEEVRFSKPTVEINQTEPQIIKPQRDEQKPNIFQMDLPEIPTYQVQQLLPIQIIPFKPNPQSTLSNNPDTEKVSGETQPLPNNQSQKKRNTTGLSNSLSANLKLRTEQKGEVQSRQVEKKQEAVDVKVRQHSQKVQTRIHHKTKEQVPIPQQLRIETLPAWRELYRSNKFECEVRFYAELKEELTRLEFFQMTEYVEEQLLIVQQIKRLSDQYSKCVDQDQEEEIHAVIKTIQKKIMSVKKEETIRVAMFCLERNGKSLTAQIYQEVVFRQPQYTPILQNLARTIKNPTKKAECFLQLGIISMCDRGSVVNKCQTYKKAIQNLLADFQQMKLNITELFQMSPENSRQIINSSRFQHYLLGTQIYLKVSNRFYGVLKLVKGEGIYRFKLDMLRNQLNSVYNSLNTKFGLSIPSIQETEAGVWLGEHFDDYFQYLSSGSYPVRLRLCQICFNSEDCLIEKSQSLFHPECWNLARQFMY